MPWELCYVTSLWSWECRTQEDSIIFPKENNKECNVLLSCISVSIREKTKRFPATPLTDFKCTQWTEVTKKMLIWEGSDLRSPWSSAVLPSAYADWKMWRGGALHSTSTLPSSVCNMISCWAAERRPRQGNLDIGFLCDFQVRFSFTKFVSAEGRRRRRSVVFQWDVDNSVAIVLHIIRISLS